MTSGVIQNYNKVRSKTKSICEHLLVEDFGVQPDDFVSPPKWHMAHVSWFFETFILTKYLDGYQPFNTVYSSLFNSYYQSLGLPFVRAKRGSLSRPTVSDIYEYTNYVDEHIRTYFQTNYKNQALDFLIIGLNHEQQHQELLLMDIKYIFGSNPLLPVYNVDFYEDYNFLRDDSLVPVEAGLYNVGHKGDDFAYDNETPCHKTYVDSFEIETSLVSNGEYLEFIKSGGYNDFDLWHSEGWEWIKNNSVKAPLYWYLIDGEWSEYKLSGIEKLNENAPVKHISFYEAFAFAEWRKMRLPTEYEWEIASDKIKYGNCWEWTSSAYTPYPGYRKESGALGEYNGKFMINQKVLKGSSIATPVNHSRNTYRNFFHPNMRWQYSGIRLVKL